MNTGRCRLTLLSSGTLGAILGLACFPAQIQGQSVEGRVLDPDNQGIPGASVSFQPLTGQAVFRVAADDLGIFRVDPILPGDYLVVTERLGFRTTESLISLVEGDSIFLELRMDVEAIPVEPIVVRASSRPSWEILEPPALWGFFERKDHHEKLGIGSFLTEADLKPLAGTNPAHAIAQLGPFLQALPHQDRPSTILLRGRRGCKPLIWVDGNLVSPRQVFQSDPQPWDPYNNPREARPPPPSILSRENEPPGRGEEAVTEFILLSEIGAIELYRGASDIPGEFRSGLHMSDCGAIVIWSKRK